MFKTGYCSFFLFKYLCHSELSQYQKTIIMDPELSDVDIEDQNSRWTKYLKDDTIVDKKSLHIIECCEDEVCPNSKLPKTMPQLIASMKAEKTRNKILPHLQRRFCPTYILWLQNIEEVFSKRDQPQNWKGLWRAKRKNLQQTF